MPIFDQGYQHWTGPLSGHAWRWLAVTRHGVRATLKNRIVRWFLFAAWMPALVLVTVLALWGLLEQQSESVLGFLRPMLPPEMIGNPRDYRSAVWTICYSFFFKAELAGALFLVLVVGPNLVSRDLRFNALPLYFSRPLRRIDYFAGKLGVIAFFLAATQILPAAVAYVFGIAFSMDVNVIRQTHRLLWGGTLYGLIITLSAGTLMLALSSLSRRSVYVGLAWSGFVLLTGMLGGLLMGIHMATAQQQIVREGMVRWVQDHPPPPGIEISGAYSFRRTVPPGNPGFPVPVDDEKEQWVSGWAANHSRLWTRANTVRAEDSRTDWRPVCSYATNLSRIGDWLLDADAAWVTVGKAIQKPRMALGPMANMHGGGRLPPDLTGPANDRALADHLVLQFPWTWSAGVLGGLWLLSVMILATRVKSLDRLK